MTDYSYLSNASNAAIEDLYQQYQQDPTSVDPGWRQFFEGFDFAQHPDSPKTATSVSEQFDKESDVFNLIGAYRQVGHLYATTNPVRPRRKHLEPIQLSDFNLSDADLDTRFQCSNRIGLENATLREIVDKLKTTYCQNVGVEYTHLRPREAAEWLQEKMETCSNDPSFDKDKKHYIFNKLNQAVGFEQFLHTKFVGQKRFSLEGAESIIPALDAIIEQGADLGIKEFVIGMAHRGRLNILANVMDKSYEDIFTEFQGKGLEDASFEGDVKYHLGYSSDRVSQNGQKVHLSLLPNPSHLEAVNPVVEGVTRAKVDFRYKGDNTQIAPILIHGDASIAGQGIIYEVLQMSLLNGYKTGGTIHVVLNNQIGFTTNYHDARSSTYCTDVAKTTLSPIFHVNGDDPEAVTYVIQMALEYRQRFHRDVFVDIVCYRKYGHNEGDEPRFTQPTLYGIIAKHPNPREMYLQSLLDSNAMSKEEAKKLETEFKEELQKDLDNAQNRTAAKVGSYLEGQWKGYRLSKAEDFETSPKTGVVLKDLKSTADQINHIPEDIKAFKKIRKLFNDRHKMVHDSNKLDWGMAELLAYGTLLKEGHPVRISGQDCERGTFSHRHAVLRLEDSEEQYIPLKNLGDNAADFEIYNSLLSEYGVLGFEYGYSMTRPDALTIWEAQFGDFVNGAQIIIDQFISAAETKWQRLSGLVMLLPHGYEGQGPEHSSARMERFLTLCSGYNIQVANCTTPANYFHLLRRQLKRDFRKPLIVMTPKSLLRHPQCVSTLQDMGKGTSFQELLDDTYADAKKVKRVLICSGKLYYELLQEQQDQKRNDVAIVRMEQLYPLPKKALDACFKKYSKAKEYIWIQEEPENMGPWSFILRKIPEITGCIARPESSTTAVGSNSIHNKQQEELIKKAFS